MPPYKMPFYHNCLCCLADAGEYLVYRDVWNGEAHLDPDDGQVCIPCLEYRIGRRLTVEDFFPFPSTVRGEDEYAVDRMGLPFLELYHDWTTNADTDLYWFPEIGVLYRRPLYEWYGGGFSLEWADKKFIKFPPGEHSDNKMVIARSIDYPADALASRARSVYYEGDQLYKEEELICQTT